MILFGRVQNRGYGFGFVLAALSLSTKHCSPLGMWRCVSSEV